jgi:sulfopyruvate decarboxylase TPP-binding subunit
MKWLTTAIIDLGFTHLPAVPCSEFDAVLTWDAAPGLILASREEEAISVACGLQVMGARPLVLLQSSGLANSLNSLGGIGVSYGVPISVLCALRGGPSETNLTQVPVGRSLPAAVQNLGCRSLMTSSPTDLRSVLADQERTGATRTEVPTVIFAAEGALT